MIALRRVLVTSTALPLLAPITQASMAAEASTDRAGPPTGGRLKHLDPLNNCTSPKGTSLKEEFINPSTAVLLQHWVLLTDSVSQAPSRDCHMTGNVCITRLRASSCNARAVGTFQTATVQHAAGAHGTYPMHPQGYTSTHSTTHHSSKTKRHEHSTPMTQKEVRMPSAQTATALTQP